MFIEKTNEAFAIDSFEMLFGFFYSFLSVVRGSLDTDLIRVS